MNLALHHLIDPRLQGLVGESRAFYAQRVPGRGPGSREELNAVRATAMAPPPSDPPAAVEVAFARGRSVPVRLHAPASGAAAGVLLQIHGGGFYLGSAAGDDISNRDLADALGLVVVSVDYRLAPEHPWPAASDDCEVAALWLAEQAQDRFGTTTLSLGGFSAGATLAMTTDCRRVLPRRLRRPAKDRTHPDLSPIYADVSGLPPILIVVGADDVLLQDNLAMAARLAAAGVDVVLRVYPASPHGFTGHATPMARAARDDIKTWLRREPSGGIPSVLEGSGR